MGSKFCPISISRRQLVNQLGGIALLALAPTPLIYARQQWRMGDPFSLGVASGSPRLDGFVIWTRLAPEPLSPDPTTPGGMTGGPVEVAYEIATDESMRSVVRRGRALAEPEFAWSMHVEIAGLKPGRPYWYRFICGEAVSRIGRAMTTGPATNALKFGFVSCAHYEHGYFSAYRHLADEHPDVVMFLGDYIYEYVDRKGATVRTHSDGVDASDLRTFRNRYAQYRLDPDLQRLHAEVPALVTWDDHEVQNDYAADVSPTFEDKATFLARRQAAYRAFYEHMPLRQSVSLSRDGSVRVYDSFQLGELAEIYLLDGRQYRSPQACYAPPDHGGAHPETAASCPELFDHGRTMLGAQQEKWLFDRFRTSRARWNVIAQDVLMATFARRGQRGDYSYWTDDWNGYPADRARLLEHIRHSRLTNPVVLSGDAHTFWANDLRLTADLGAPVLATEFLTTSVSANPPPPNAFRPFLPDNPSIRYFEDKFRGYVCADLAPDALTVKYRALSDVRDPRATVSTLKTFAVENGRPAVVEA
jgi:alkaline phosphatase D